MEELGIKTEADVTKIKSADKEGIAKLDKLEKILEAAEEKGAATEEHKKIKAAIAAHKATFGKDTTTGGDKDTTTGGDKDTTTGETQGEKVPL